MKARLVLAALALLVVSAVARADTVVITFDATPQITFGSYTESGFNFRSRAPGVMRGPGVLDFFYDGSANITLTGTGPASVFDLVSFQPYFLDTPLLVTANTGASILLGNNVDPATISLPPGFAGVSWVTFHFIAPPNCLGCERVLWAAGLDNFVVRDNAAASAVPEPASLFLLGTGLAGVGAAVRRRRNVPEVLCHKKAQNTQNRFC